MSRRRAVVVGSCAVAGALLLTTRVAADRPDRSFGAVVKRVDSGVLRVESRGCGRTMLGTGFLVDRRHVVTAAHVVEGATEIVLKRADRTVGTGTLAGTDAASDVALIRLDAPIRGRVLSLSKREAKATDGVAAIGYPLGGPLTVARGYMLGTATTVPSPGAQSRPLIQTDAAVSHGESGGPLVSVSEGKVVGMLDSSSAKGARLSFAVSVRDAAPLIARWRRDPEAVPQRPCRGPTGYPTLPQPSPRSDAALPPPAHM